MSVFQKLLDVFGLGALHDLDLIDDPGRSWPVDPVSRLDIEASTLTPTCAAPGVDGPAVQSGEASTAGHPNQQRDEIRALLETADDILRDTLQDIVTRMSTIVREATAVVELVQQLDPTPIGLVRASKVTDINSKRSR